MSDTRTDQLADLISQARVIAAELLEELPKEHNHHAHWAVIRLDQAELSVTELREVI